MKKIKMFFVFLFATLVFATGCGYLPDLDVSFTSNSNGNSSSVTKEYYDMSGVSFNGASYVYDGEEHSLSIEGTLPDGVSVMYLNNNKVNAGTYEVTAKFTGDTKNYHPIEDMKATLTIAKAGVSGISFLGDTVTYDGNPHSIEINGELPEGILVTYSGNEQVNVGEYEVVAHFTDTTGNYVELSNLKATLTINKATYDMSGIKFNSASYTYDGIEKEVKIDGVLPSGVEVLYENNRMINAGTIEAIAMFKHNNPNYNDIPNKTATLTISKASIEGISFSGDTVTYDGKAHSLRIEGKLPAGVYVTYINNGHINAGTYTVTAHFEDSTGNYEYLPDLEATLVINKVDVNEIEFNGKTVVYNGEVHSLEIEGTLPSGVQVIYSNNNHINAGTYTVVASFIDTTGNYNIVERLEAILTISKASIEGISFSGDTVTYDGKEHSLNIEGELPNGVYVSYSNNNHINAGTYTVTAHFEDTTGNYNYLPDLEAILIINKVKINNIEFNDESIIYDGKSHSLEIEGTLPNGVQIIYSNNKHTNAGTYTVIASFIDTTGNYEVIDSLEATLTINKKTIEISFNNKEVTYNGEKHILKLNDTLPSGVYVVYTDNEFINAGTYEVIAQIIDTTGNYNIEEYLTAKLVINKATYDMNGVSFNSSLYTYDGTAKGVVINGSLPNGVSVTYSNNNQVNAGEYEVIASFKGDENNYYPIENMTSILTINKASIEGLSFVGFTSTYNGLRHYVSVKGNIPDGVIVEYSNNGKINAGEYEVTAVFYDTTGNYIVPEPMTTKIIINKLTVNVTLEDKTFSYDGKYHSLSLEGYIPEGIEVTNTNNSFNKAGEYIVTYSFIDTTGNYNIVESLEATLSIVKDGKYHDVVFTFEDGTTKEYVVANDNYLYNIPSIPYKKGHTGEWDNDTSLPITNDIVFNIEYTPNQYMITYNANGGELEETTQVVTYGEEFELYVATKEGYSISGYSYYSYSSWGAEEITNGTYLFDSDINVAVNWTANKYKVNYYDGETLIAIEEATYDSSYTFRESYTKDELTLVRWIFDGEEYNPTSELYMFNYAEDINVYAKFYKLNNDYTYSGSTITGYIGTDIELVIPEYVGSGNTYYKVTEIGNQAFYENYDVISVTMLENLEYIGGHSFENCINLCEVNFSYGLKSIGSCAFLGCIMLKQIIMPHSVEYVGEQVFKDCVALEYIELSNKLTIISDSMFGYCKNLQEILFPKNINSIEQFAFENCKNLLSIILPDSIDYIGQDAFSGCSSLEYIDLPIELTEISECMLYSCNKLKHIVLPNSIKIIKESSFMHCDNLEYIILPESVKMIEKHAFNNSLSIFINADEIPKTWDENWSINGGKVYIKDTWEYINNIPTPKKFTITLDTQGGELEEYTKVVNYGEEVTLPMLIKNNYIFDGWLYNGEMIENVFIFNFIEDITLVARWEKSTEKVNEEKIIKEVSDIINDAMIYEEDLVSFEMEKTSSLNSSVEFKNAEFNSSFTLYNEGITNYYSDGTITTTATETFKAVKGGRYYTIVSDTSDSENPVMEEIRGYNIVEEVESPAEITQSEVDTTLGFASGTIDGFGCAKSLTGLFEGIFANYDPEYSYGVSYNTLVNGSEISILYFSYYTEPTSEWSTTVYKYTSSIFFNTSSRIVGASFTQDAYYGSNYNFETHSPIADPNISYNWEYTFELGKKVEATAPYDVASLIYSDYEVKAYSDPTRTVEVTEFEASANLYFGFTGTPDTVTADKPIIESIDGDQICWTSTGLCPNYVYLSSSGTATFTFVSAAGVRKSIEITVKAPSPTGISCWADFPSVLSVGETLELPWVSVSPYTASQEIKWVIASGTECAETYYNAEFDTHYIRALATGTFTFYACPVADETITTEIYEIEIIEPKSEDEIKSILTSNTWVVNDGVIYSMTLSADGKGLINFGRESTYTPGIGSVEAEVDTTYSFDYVLDYANAVINVSNGTWTNRSESGTFATFTDPVITPSLLGDKVTVSFGSYYSFDFIPALSEDEVKEAYQTTFSGFFFQYDYLELSVEFSATHATFFAVTYINGEETRKNEVSVEYTWNADGNIELVNGDLNYSAIKYFDYDTETDITTNIVIDSVLKVDKYLASYLSVTILADEVSYTARFTVVY